MVMSDISKCKGTKCPLRETCYRYTAKASEFMQSYFVGTPYDKKDKDCEYYWETKESENDCTNSGRFTKPIK